MRYVKNKGIETRKDSSEDNYDESYDLNNKRIRGYIASHPQLLNVLLPEEQRQELIEKAMIEIQWAKPITELEKTILFQFQIYVLKGAIAMETDNQGRERYKFVDLTPLKFKI